MTPGVNSGYCPTNNINMYFASTHDAFIKFHHLVLRIFSINIKFSWSNLLGNFEVAYLSTWREMLTNCTLEINLTTRDVIPSNIYGNGTAMVRDDLCYLTTILKKYSNIVKISKKMYIPAFIFQKRKGLNNGRPSSNVTSTKLQRLVYCAFCQEKNDCTAAKKNKKS